MSSPAPPEDYISGFCENRHIDHPAERQASVQELWKPTGRSGDGPDCHNLTVSSVIYQTLHL